MSDTHLWQRGGQGVEVVLDRRLRARLIGGGCGGGRMGFFAVLGRRGRARLRLSGDDGGGGRGRRRRVRLRADLVRDASGGDLWPLGGGPRARGRLRGADGLGPRRRGAAATFLARAQRGQRPHHRR